MYIKEGARKGGIQSTDLRGKYKVRSTSITARKRLWKEDVVEVGVGRYF